MHDVAVRNSGYVTPQAQNEKDGFELKHSVDYALNRILAGRVCSLNRCTE